MTKREMWDFFWEEYKDLLWKLVKSMPWADAITILTAFWIGRNDPQWVAVMLLADIFFRLGVILDQLRRRK